MIYRLFKIQNTHLKYLVRQAKNTSWCKIMSGFLVFIVVNNQKIKKINTTGYMTYLVTFVSLQI